MITIKLTDKQVIFAKNVEKEIISNLPEHKNPNGMEREGRYYIGTVGELAFGAHLKRLGKKFDYLVRTDGKSDDGDYRVYMDSRNVKVDVKTGGGIHLYFMYVPLVVYEKHNDCIYVGTRYNAEKKEVEIWGWAFDSDLRSVPGKKDKDGNEFKSMGIEYQNLRPIESLTDKIINNKL